MIVNCTREDLHTLSSLEGEECLHEGSSVVRRSVQDLSFVQLDYCPRVVSEDCRTHERKARRALGALVCGKQGRLYRASPRIDQAIYRAQSRQNDSLSAGIQGNTQRREAPSIRGGLACGESDRTCSARTQAARARQIGAGRCVGKLNSGAHRVLRGEMLDVPQSISATGSC